MLYFAYGSNMSSLRLKKRVPSAEFVAIAKLRDHRLAFHKISNDGSGKADAFETGNEDDFIWGVVFEMDQAEEEELDAAEGYPTGYDKKTVGLVSARGEKIEASTYVAKMIGDGLVSYDWYLEHVIRGATEHKLPTDYCATLKAIIVQQDENLNRTGKERSIYDVR